LAKNKGDFVERGGPSPVYPTLREGTTDQLQIADAVFQAQWLVCGPALCYRENHRFSDRENNFSVGRVGFHLTATAAYTTFPKDHKKEVTTGACSPNG
jgi:hypothetical protein